MKTQFNVCIIGCGVISDNHIPSLLDLDNVKIKAICDIKKDKAIAKVVKYKLACPVYTDYITMLDMEKPDAVHILTPHHLHTEMVLEALKRDINVFLEKPMCIKEEDIDKLINAEKNSKARVSVSFQTRYNQTNKMAREIIMSDGGVENAYGTVIWNRNADYYAQDEWRGKWATEGGGVMINQAIHTIDLLCFFIGIPKNVQAICSTLRHTPPVEVEDSCECIIGFENGKSATLYATNNFPGHDTTCLHIETKNHILEIREPNIFVDGEKLDTSKDTKYMGKQCYGNSHRTLIAEFYHSIDKNLPTPVPLSQAQHAVRVILNAYKSNGKIIEL